MKILSQTKVFFLASFLLTWVVACNSPTPTEVLPVVNTTTILTPPPAITSTVIDSALVLPTASDRPFPRSTPVNENHIAPTPIGQVTQNQAFDLYDKRIKEFENTLEFSISVTDISLYTNKTIDSMFIVNIQGVLKNITDKPLVVRKELRAGFTDEPEIYFGFAYNGKSLAYPQCCVDGILRMNQDDYVILPPGKSRIYLWAIPLSLTMDFVAGQEISLSGKPIKIGAFFVSHDIGFSLRDEKEHLVTSKDENGDLFFYTVDMNMWVGQLKSNEITVKFP